VTEPSNEAMDEDILNIVHMLWQYTDNAIVEDVVSRFIATKPPLLSSHHNRDLFWFWARRVEESLRRLEKQIAVKVTWNEIRNDSGNDSGKNSITSEIRAVPILDQVAVAAKLG
jgi:hypothetical protein